jgi:hypothetical protein
MLKCCGHVRMCSMCARGARGHVAQHHVPQASSNSAFKTVKSQISRYV